MTFHMNFKRFARGADFRLPHIGRKFSYVIDCIMLNNSNLCNKRRNGSSFVAVNVSHIAWQCFVRYCRKIHFVTLATKYTKSKSRTKKWTFLRRNYIKGICSVLRCSYCFRTIFIGTFGTDHCENCD